MTRGGRVEKFFISKQFVAASEHPARGAVRRYDGGSARDGWLPVAFLDVVAPTPPAPALLAVLLKRPIVVLPVPAAPSKTHTN